MKRRSLLAGIAAGAAATAGCTTRDPADRWGNHVTCGLDSIEYEYLPERMRDEVDAAFSEGQYETDGTLSYETRLDEPEAQALSKDGTYYAATIERDGETTVLRFDETVPTLWSPRPISFANRSDEPLEIEFTLAYETGEILTDEDGAEIAGREASLDPSERVSMSVLDRYTSYELSISSGDDHETRVSFDLNRQIVGPSVYVYGDEITVGAENGGEATCPWGPALD